MLDLDTHTQEEEVAAPEAAQAGVAGLAAAGRSHCNGKQPHAHLPIGVPVEGVPIAVTG